MSAPQKATTTTTPPPAAASPPGPPPASPRRVGLLEAAEIEIGHYETKLREASAATSEAQNALSMYTATAQHHRAGWPRPSARAAKPSAKRTAGRSR